MDQNYTNPAGTTTTTVVAPAPQGKGMGIAGFIISLVALVVWLPISIAAAAAALLGSGMGLAVGWLVVSLLGTLLSVMGMMKLGRTRGKRGLAITGMVLGIVAVCLSASTISGVNKIHKTVGTKGREILENLGDSTKLQQSLNDLTDTMKNAQ